MRTGSAMSRGRSGEAMAIGPWISFRGGERIWPL